MQRNIKMSGCLVLLEWIEYDKIKLAESIHSLQVVAFNNKTCFAKRYYTKIKAIQNRKNFSRWIGVTKKEVDIFLSLEEKRRKCKEILK